MATKKQKRKKTYFGGVSSQHTRLKKSPLYSLLPEQLDLSPGSMHWFPLVDLHYLMHFFEDNPNIIRLYEERLREGGKGLRARGINFALLPSLGPNIENYLIMKKAYLLEGRKRGEFSLSEYADEVIGLHTHGYAFIQNDFNQAAKDFMYPRVITSPSNSFKAKLWSKLPWLGKSRRYQSHHLQLQERFNEQTRRSQKVHQDLEELLSIGDLSQERDRTILHDINQKIDYDLGAVQALEKEEELFQRVRPGLFFNPKHHTDHLDVYKNILEERRTAFDFVRNLVLRGVADSLEAAIELYDNVDHPLPKEIIADRFLRNIDLQFYVDSIVPQFDKKVLRKIVDLNRSSFNEVYEHYQESLAKQIGIVERVNRYHKRYQTAMAGNNPLFLLSAIGNDEEFNRKNKFDRNFGKVDDPETAYGFLQACNSAEYQRIHNALNRHNITAWLRVVDEGLLETVVSINYDEFEIVRRTIDRSLEDGLVMLQFLRDYETATDLLETRRGSDSGINPRDRIDILREERYEIMRDYLGHIVQLDEERKKNELYRALKPRVFTSDEPVRRLIETDRSFVSSNLERLQKARKVYQQSGDDQEYLIMMTALADAGSTEDRAQSLDRYYAQLCSPEDGKESGKESDRKKKKHADRKEEKRKDGKKDRSSGSEKRREVMFEHLVIIGGLPGVDYAARLRDEIEITRLSVLGPNDLTRLNSQGPDAGYILVTNSLSHASMRIVHGLTDNWAYSPTHGQRNLCDAARRLYFNRK